MPIETLNAIPLISLILTVILVSATSAILFRYIPRSSELKGFSAIRYFILGFLGIALAFCSFTLRPFISETLSIILNNIIYLFSSYCFLYGLKHRQNPRSKNIHQQAIFFIHLSILLFVNVGILHLYHDDFIARVLFLHINICFVQLYQLKYIRKSPVERTIGETVLSVIIVIAGLLTFASALIFVYSQNLMLYMAIMSATQSVQLHLWFGALCILLLSDIIERLYERSIKDDLTGVHNRRYFMEHATLQATKIEQQGNENCAMILCDIDHFKRINDSYGHHTGDQVITEVAQKLKSLIRDDDVLARIGGEEFAIFLPYTSQASAEKIAERMRQGVMQTQIKIEPPLSITASFGVVTCGRTHSVDKLLNRADMAMYKAKRAGRNQIKTYQPDVVYDTY